MDLNQEEILKMWKKFFYKHQLRLIKIGEMIQKIKKFDTEI